MPPFVASIEVYFNADTPQDAERYADFLADVIEADPREAFDRIKAVTSGVAPEAA